MNAISNLYLTHGVMLLCALAAAYTAFTASIGRIIVHWWSGADSRLARRNLGSRAGRLSDLG
jgi:hypothetical protein